MKTVLYLVRHGETVWNIRQIMQGHLDSELTEKGIRQAHLLGKKLQSIPIDVVFSSDLGRASNTSDIIAEYLRIPVILSGGLREKNGGIFQGLTWQKAAEKYPKEYSDYRNSGSDYIVPDGESWEQATDRFVSTMRQIISSQRGKTVLVVSHGGLINGLLRYVLQIPLDAPRRFTVRNSSINRIFAEDDELWLDKMGDDGHLSEEGLDEIC